MKQQQQPKKWTKGQKITIFSLLGLILLVGMIGSKSESTGNAAAAASLTAFQKDSIAKVDSIATRQKQIETGFSAWDGSHKELVILVKANMNDPESFDHVETKYWDMGNEGIVVLMKYRGKNAFGGVVTETIKAKAGIDGHVVKIMD